LPAAPVIAVHAGAGPGTTDPAHHERALAGLREALRRGGQALRDGGEALDGVQAAVAYMEDEVEIFNAGRGAVLTDEGQTELSASIMRGRDRDAGAAALITRSRFPVAAARAILDHSPHVLMSGPAADAFAAAHGVELCDPSYFVTERQRARLTERGSDYDKGTVGAVCLDATGCLAAATSTGGRRGQMAGRVGDTPVIRAQRRGHRRHDRDRRVRRRLPAVHLRGDEPRRVAAGRRASGLGLNRGREELGGGVLDQAVDLIGGHHAGPQEGRDPLDRREVDHAHPLGVAGGQQRGVLGGDDQFQDRSEGGPRGGVDLGVDLAVVAVLAREHQLQQIGVADREVDVGVGDRADRATVVVGAGLVMGGPQRRAEAREAGQRERVEQRPAIGEMATRGGVGDADVTGELAQRQRGDAALADHLLGAPQQRLAQVAVVVAALDHPTDGSG
jgi:hypothetical protein